MGTTIKLCKPTCPQYACEDFLECEEIWGDLNENKHPCAQAKCDAFNHALKCANKRHTDCALERGFR